MLLFIPGYNCKNQITRVLNQINQDVAKYIDEIIFIDNCSTDHTEKTILNYKKPSFFPPLHIFRNDQNYGLGGSHKVAFEYAIKQHHQYIIVLHGDDQGDINDILPILKSGEYKKYDCMLGSRFMKKSRLKGYSKFRTFGNRVYNILFSLVVHRKIYDLGSGLNIYKTSTLTPPYYLKFPDKLTFNYCMILATNYYKQKIAFFPISWRESDQKSNVKLISQAFDVLKILFRYNFNHNFITTELRSNPIKKYTYKEVHHEK